MNKYTLKYKQKIGQSTFQGFEKARRDKTT